MQMRTAVFIAGGVALLISGAQRAPAAGMNLQAQAQLVPYATYTDTGATTAVGVMSDADGTVYWGFYDVNGNRLHGGSFTMEADRLHPFVWSGQAAGAPADLSGTDGFLVFAIDTNGDGEVDSTDTESLGANAFHVDPEANDVIYLPTANVSGSDLSDPSPALWVNNPVENLSGNAGQDVDEGDVTELQYLIDGATGGDDTLMYLWSNVKLPSSTGMTLHDGAGANKSISVSLLNNHLNIVNIEDNPGLSSGFFGDGYVRWTVPSIAGATLDMFIFSVAISPSFGAAQTLLVNYDE